MDLIYRSTRGDRTAYTASQAVLKGLAADGGLFVPDELPRLSRSLEDLQDMNYQELACEVMKLFLTDYTEEELKRCVEKAYDEKFDTKEIAPLVKKHGAYYLDLFHGATIAFKDMALSILPYLMVTAAEKNRAEKEIVILTATSGDTGKAAMAGFADVPGTRIIVFYPKDGVSPVQERQMVTQKGKNTFVVGIRGNFDDAQSGVKRLFGDQELADELAAAGFQFSSANSINIGRLVPQVVYYVYAYTRLLKSGEIKNGETVNVVVPTGNFGNILAAYYAKHLGVPFGTLICASNDNKVLYDFFRTGCYDRNREFVLTSSPSMDILISSNLERLLYLADNRNAEANARRMQELSREGRYTVTEEMSRAMEDFYGNYASEEEVSRQIARVFQEDGYVLDPHTAVASCVWEKYREETGDDTKTLIVSTASPYKFTRTVMEAIAPDKAGQDDFALADALAELSKVPVPEAVESIRRAPVLHTRVCGKDQMKETVKEILGI